MCVCVCVCVCVYIYVYIYIYIYITPLGKGLIVNYMMQIVCPDNMLLL